MTARARIGLAIVALLSLAPSAGERLPPVAARPLEPAEDLAPRGPSVERRLAEIQRRVQRAAEYPAIARERGVAGETWVEFEIDADGLAKRVETARSSGHSSLDRAALSAVERAGALPWVYGRVTVPVLFSLRDGPN